jgi:hypothetical protein
VFLKRKAPCPFTMSLQEVLSGFKLLYMGPLILSPVYVILYSYGISEPEIGRMKAS